MIQKVSSSLLSTSEHRYISEDDYKDGTKDLFSTLRMK